MDFKKPRIYFSQVMQCWMLDIHENLYRCISWQEAILTFNKIRFERIVSNVK
jgi:hypothetical protein